MKFKVYHIPANKALSIPRAAVELSGLAGKQDLSLHVDSGCVLLLSEVPTTQELLKTICLLATIAPQLISDLAHRSERAMEMEQEEAECSGCEHGEDCFGLSIPPCQLERAGIGQHADLGSFVEKGKVIIQAAEKTHADRIMDMLGDDVRTMLEDAGVQLAGVYRLLEQEITHE